MFRAYLKSDELLSICDISRFVKGTQLQSAINSAIWILSRELRNRDYDLTRLYIPNMFDSLDVFKTCVGLGGFSDSIIGNSEQRFCFDMKTDVQCSVTLYGSNDNSTFVQVSGISGEPFILNVSGIGLHSAIFPETFKYYKYYLDSENAPVEYSAFLVDTSLDLLIIYRTIVNVLSPVLSDNSSILAIYKNFKELYEIELSNLNIPYDADESGIIEATETKANNSTIFVR
jgi:hypothetical protein